MAELNFVQAINRALSEEMRRDERVLVLGQDVGKVGGVFRVTEGLQEAFGEDRVIDTPLSEGGIVGTAIGMAMYGMRPVAEIQFADFIYPAFDQIVSEAAKLRYRSGGEYHAPMVIRAPLGGGIRGGLYHSQSPEAFFTHVPGLKVVCPSNPYDAKGLLLSAIRDEDPVIFFEPKRVYRAVKGEVPDEEYSVPIGEPKTVREGDKMTVVAWGAMLFEAAASAEELAAEGVEVELIDLRTLWPVNMEPIFESVRRTGRFAVVHEAPKTSGFGAELVAQVTEEAFLNLEAPPQRITGWDTPFPYVLENEYLPLQHRITPVLRDLARF